MSRKGRIKVTEISFPGLEEQLKHLAQTDWERFMLLTKLDKVQIFVCVERQKGKSLQQIANKLKVTKAAVQNRCKACGDRIPADQKTQPPGLAASQ